MHLGEKDTPKWGGSKCKGPGLECLNTQWREMTSCHESTLYAGSNGK